MESLGARLSIILNSISEVIKDIYNEKTECVFIKVKDDGIILIPKDNEILTILFKANNDILHKIIPIIQEIIK